MQYVIGYDSDSRSDVRGFDLFGIKADTVFGEHAMHRSVGLVDSFKRRALTFVSLAALLGCGSPLSPADDLRRGDPFVDGHITYTSLAADGGTSQLHVQATSYTDADCGRGLVSVDVGRADIRWSDGNLATASELLVGRQVRVWAVGSVLLGCTPSITAGAITLVNRPED